MKLALGLITVTLLGAGCTSDAERIRHVDVHGSYPTTADYNAMHRADFANAMNKGLIDFDQRLAMLSSQATALGPDALEEYHDALDGLLEQRRLFVAEIERHRAMLDVEWAERREEVAEMYIELREALDEVFEDVIDEGD